MGGCPAAAIHPAWTGMYERVMESVRKRTDARCNHASDIKHAYKVLDELSDRVEVMRADLMFYGPAAAESEAEAVEDESDADSHENEWEDVDRCFRGRDGKILLKTGPTLVGPPMSLAISGSGSTI